MTAIPGYTDQEIEEAIRFYDELRRDESQRYETVACIALDAVRKCQAAVWGVEMHDYIDAPSGRQIAEGFKEPGKWKIEGWSPRLQAWVDCSIVWRKDSDIPNPGYRLVPIPKPRTEKVPILEALERMPSGLAPVRFEKIIKNGYTASLVIIAGDHIFDPDDDGMVEVLIEDDE